MILSDGHLGKQEHSRRIELHNNWIEIDWYHSHVCKYEATANSQLEEFSNKKRLETAK